MFDSLVNIFRFEVLGPWIFSLFFGIFVGGIPGLTATMAVALLVPLSYYMPPLTGFAMIIGASFTSIFAGDIPATFLRIPGTPASGAAVLDGYELTKKGQGSLALGLDLICSALGGIIGVLLLIFVSNFLAKFALKFTHFEYFWLGVFGLSMSAIITNGSKLKGLISVLIGLALAMIGMDITTGYPRFAYGVTDLMNGVNFIAAMIGLFGLSEAFKYISNPHLLQNPSISEKAGISFKSVFKYIWEYKRRIFSSSILGTIIGALPGAGADIASWVVYGIAKKTSKKPEEFGRGSVEGVIAPTSANNAAIGGTWIPALVFGIPGDTITAIVLGAMIMYGLTPGPLIFQNNSELVNNIFCIALVTQVLLVFVGLIGIKAFTHILKLPRNIVITAVIVFSMVGAFVLNNSTFDIGIMLLLGFLGYCLEKADIPLCPLILALILGPMIENNLRVGLVKTGGSLLPFIIRPISFVLIIIIVLVFFGDCLVSLVRHYWRSGHTDG
jgi:putative tricarboxylic transport membrane protein